MNKSGYGKDGIYRSLRPALFLPSDPNLSLVSFLFRNSFLYSDELALIDADTEEILTFSQLKSMVTKVSHGLVQMGIKKGDVVLILAPNSIKYPVCFLGIVALGAIATTINPVYTVAEISKQIKDSGPKLVITVTELWDKVKGFGLPVVILGSSTSSEMVPNSRITHFSDLVKMVGPISDFPVASVKQTDVAALFYSSGTTGTSKGVILTHRNFIAAGLMATVDQDCASQLNNVFLCFLPMFHISGLSILTIAQLQRGNTVISMGKFNLERVLNSIEKYRVTHLYVVPPVMVAFAKQSVGKKYDLSSLKLLGSGAAPLGKDVIKEVAKNFPQAAVIQVMEKMPIGTCIITSLVEKKADGFSNF